MIHIIDNFGNEHWVNAYWHFDRTDGGPAYISVKGDEEWFKNNNLYRWKKHFHIEVNGHDGIK